VSNLLGNIDVFTQDLSGLDVVFDEEIFNRALDLIVGLEPEQLNDEQLEEVMSLLDDLKTEDDITELRKSKRSAPEKRREARQYWRRNKQKIKLKRKKFRKSAEGRKRKRNRTRLAKSGRTAMGRRKVEYHV